MYFCRAVFHSSESKHKKPVACAQCTVCTACAHIIATADDYKTERLVDVTLYEDIRRGSHNIVPRNLSLVVVD